jgi:imidazolonepropionase-like amidohydrolase
MRVFGCLLGLCGLFLAHGADFLIRNVTVVDVKTGGELSKSSVWIHNGQIAAVGERTGAPAVAAVVNGAGKYLIPGLWDMHVHLWYREHQFPLFLANGVTGVRDMGSDLNWVNHWRDEIKAGKLLGPRIHTCGPPVDGQPSGDAKLPVLVVHTPNDARATFDRLDNMDVDFVKVLSNVPRDAYFALIERARKWYIPVAGHVPESVSLMEAIDARQKSVEHMTGVLLACSKHEDNLRKRVLLALEAKDVRSYEKIDTEILRSFDAKKADELFERMARFETREVPTLIMLRREMFPDTKDALASPHLKYISASIRKTWSNSGETEDPMPESTRALLAAEYTKLSELLLQMKRAGVKIMAGTDTGDPYTFPGYDLHRELELLVSAGLTPLDALRSATIEPAEYLGAEESIGTIQKGMAADLVLLDADPLADIRNTQKIDGVFVDGKYLSKARLVAMLGSGAR